MKALPETPALPTTTLGGSSRHFCSAVQRASGYVRRRALGAGQHRVVRWEPEPGLRLIGTGAKHTVTERGSIMPKFA